MLELIGKCDRDSPAEPTLTGVSGKAEVLPEIKRAPPGVTACSQLHDYPLDCAQNFCDYDCKNKKCEKGDSIPFEQGDSSLYCFNPCHCNKAGFAYDVTTGDCKDRQPICDKIEFFPGSCQRTNKGTVDGHTCPDIYYGYRGVLCKNSEQKGNCEIEKTIIAVNLAGEERWHTYTFNHCK